MNNVGLAQLCRTMDDVISYNIRISWGPPEHLNSTDYVGFYLLTAKGANTATSNILILVFYNNVTISIPAEGVNKTLSYYYTLRFENVWCYSDGSLLLSTPQKPLDKVEANIPGHNFYYMGYASLDALEAAQIRPQLGMFDCQERWGY